MKSGGWNRTSADQPKVKKGGARKVPGAWCLVLGAVCLAVLSVGAYFLFSGGDDAAKDETAKGRGRIKEVTPAAAPKFVEKEKPPEKKKIPFWEVPKSQTNGFSEAMQRKWRHKHYPPACYTNTTSLTEAPPSYAIFNHPCENRIAAYLTIEPGQTMVGTPVFGERFEKEFLKSCEEPIIINEDDTEETKALKNLMKETKIELRNRMAAGEKLSDIMDETHREIQKLGAAKRQIEQLVHEQLKEVTSEQDVDDIVAAANKMLEEKGVAPISVNPILRKNIKRRLMNGGNR